MQKGVCMISRFCSVRLFASPWSVACHGVLTKNKKVHSTPSYTIHKNYLKVSHSPTTIKFLEISTLLEKSKAVSNKVTNLPCGLTLLLLGIYQREAKICPNIPYMWMFSEDSFRITWCMVLKNVIHACNSIGLVAKSCPTLVTPWTVACQVPLSIGFSRQEYWSGLPISFSRESSQPRNSSQPRIIQQKYEPQMQTTIRMNLRSTMLNEASLCWKAIY